MTFAPQYMFIQSCFIWHQTLDCHDKVAFNKNKTLFHQQIGFNLRKKLITSYICDRALYSAETWTLRQTDHKHLETFEMPFWRRKEKISWTDRVENKEVLQRIQGRMEHRTYHKWKESELTGFVTSCVGSAFYNTLL